MGSSYLSEFIESVLNDSFNNLQHSKDENKRILSLLVLRDRQILIRQAAGEALSACLVLMQQRENQKKNDFYYTFLTLIQELPKDGRNESIHGYLIAINSFLNNSMEFCGSSIDSIYSTIQSYFNTKEVYIKITIIRAPSPSF